MSKRLPIDRRQFIGLGALAAAAAATTGLAGCSPQTASKETSTDTAASGAAADGTPSFLVAPEPIDDADITKTIEADIVIVGSGVAGLAAARAATEKGASVAVIEKGATWQYRSGQYGVHGSQVQKSAGMDFDAQAAVADLMKEMGYRPDQRLWNHWRDGSGKAFDWLLEPAGDYVEFLLGTATTYDPSKITLAALHFPAPEAYHPNVEYSPTYPEATMAFIPDQKAILELTYQKAVDGGADFHFATWARQLVRAQGDGRIESVLAQDQDGAYLKFNASKAVIMCAGDYGNNAEMVKYYCGGRTFSTFFGNIDADGEITNTGDGQRMASWIGAKIEDGPHAPMTHTLGTALGTDAFFLANTNGFRFCNEDVAGQQLSTQLYRQPNAYAWQIFDDKYPEQVEYMAASHGSVNHVVDDAQNPHLDGAAVTIGRTAFTSREEVEATKGIIIANTLEELVSKMNLSDQAQKDMLASIAHYNDLCAAGNDTDFGKVSTRLFPIKNPPFYACQMAAGVQLVCLGGLTTDPETLNVLDQEFNPIEGLYAAGNNMGGRILQDYPVTIGGVSHATALLFGKMAGEVTAAL